MFAEYLRAAMHRARYEWLDEDKVYCASIPGFPGVLATGPTLESCREELVSVLEGWILLGISEHSELPVVDGIDLNVRHAA